MPGASGLGADSGQGIPVGLLAKWLLAATWPIAGVLAAIWLSTRLASMRVPRSGWRLPAGSAYTFVDDHAGQVTGQGFQDFFVATPGLAPIAGSSAPVGTIPAAPSGNGYGY